MNTKLVLLLCLIFVLVACSNTATAPAENEMPESETVVAPTNLPAPPQPTEKPTAKPTDLPTEAPPVAVDPKLAVALQAIVDKQVAEMDIPGVILSVNAPDMGLAWKGAAGMADPETGLEMIPNDQFALASATKMVTAVIILQLVEQGKLALDDPITNYLPEELVSQVHVLEGESYGDQITIRQLLNHTSGFSDFSSDTDADENGIPDLKELVQAEPDHNWTTDEVVAYALETSPPLFAPSEGWNYSDLNYQLLGLIIEERTGMPLHEVYRQSVFEPLGMDHSYLEFREEPVAGVNGRSLSHLIYQDWDWTENQARSYDWGAGGIVSTAADQEKFMWALVNGDLFDDPSLVEEMYDWQDIGFSGWSYGFGLLHIDLEDPTLGLVTGHSGTWNNFAYYNPEHNLVMVGTFNSSEPAFGHLGMVIETLYTIDAVSN